MRAAFGYPPDVRIPVKMGVVAVVVTGSNGGVPTFVVVVDDIFEDLVE